MGEELASPQFIETRPGTPGGETLRQSWHPIAVVEQLTDEHPIRPLRVLSEGLVLYRDKGGRVGLIQERCTHHGVLLAYGHVDEDALICPYHQWHFDVGGNCWAAGYQSKRFEMPWSNARAYPVEEHNGVYWAYLGPAPAPALLADGRLATAGGAHRITVHPKIEANWAALPDPPHEATLWLRTPIDDLHTWQISVERIGGDSRPDSTEVVFVDEEDGKPFAELARGNIWG